MYIQIIEKNEMCKVLYGYLNLLQLGPSQYLCTLCISFLLLYLFTHSFRTIKIEVGIQAHVVIASWFCFWA